MEGARAVVVEASSWRELVKAGGRGARAMVM